MNLHKYTLTQLRQSVLESISIRDCLLKLDVAIHGGNYDIFKKACAYYNVDISHFKGQSSTAGKKTGYEPKNKISLDSILQGLHPTYQTGHLNKRLLREGIFSHICSSCGGTTWMGKEIPLELDHINGINNDHRLENLRLLCPNCHAQTDTYCGKNKKVRSPPPVP